MDPRFFLTGLVVLIALAIVVALVITAVKALAARLKRDRVDE
jgi:formate hydrogenlyase subunit 4